MDILSLPATYFLTWQLNPLILPQATYMKDNLQEATNLMSFDCGSKPDTQKKLVES